jgi:manganese/zinc/iron transport system permease protein
LQARIHREHLLRAIYEALEAREPGEAVADGDQNAPVSLAALEAVRAWTPRQLQALVRRGEARGLVRLDAAGQVRLTPRGFREAEQVTYDHRLWELFLTHYADIAPSQVDRGADTIEHVLDADMVAELESLLPEHQRLKRIPPSLHPIGASGAAGAE